jgi:hypothetical protein
MTTHKDGIYQYGGVPVASAVGSVGLAGGKTFFVDVANGTAGNSGKTPADAISDVAIAYGYTTAGQNDTVVLIGSGSAWSPSETLTWAKSYTHLVAAAVPLPGMGNRARIEASASADLTKVIEVSGSGCLFSGIKCNNMADADVDSGDVLVSGSRNMFVDCELFGMGHTTPAARAGSYSVSVTGSENHFLRTTIGADTVLRAAANAELILWGSGPRNSFTDCTFRSNCDTAGKFMVKLDVNSGDLRSVIFEDCLFYNYSTNHATTLTDAFTISGSRTHDVILKGENILIGIDGWANNANYVEAAGAAPNAGYGVALKLT